MRHIRPDLFRVSFFPQVIRMSPVRATCGLASVLSCYRGRKPLNTISKFDALQYFRSREPFIGYAS